jgi:hypothetical protein
MVAPVSPVGEGGLVVGDQSAHGRPTRAAIDAAANAQQRIRHI